MLASLLNEITSVIAGIPEHDLNTWLPDATRTSDQQMNTFAAQCVHVAESGSWMTVLGLGEQPRDRNRDAEFISTSTHDAIHARFDELRAQFHDTLSAMDDRDLADDPAITGWQERGWRKGEVLLHIIDHTALHLGHMQIQKQLWIAEQDGQAG